MEKLCLLLLSCALWIDPVPVVPAANGPSTKGGVLGNGVTQWTTVEINGILDYDDGLRPRVPEFGVWIGYGISAEGKWFGLDFGGNKELEELAKKLIGKRVLMRGKVEERTLDGFIKRQIKVVAVSELESVDLDLTGCEPDSVCETINLQIVGALNLEVLQSEPPQYLWTMTVDGKAYVLKFSQGIPKEKPGSLEGKRVVATGRSLIDGKVLVTGIREATDR